MSSCSEFCEDGDYCAGACVFLLKLIFGLILMPFWMPVFILGLIVFIIYKILDWIVDAIIMITNIPRYFRDKRASVELAEKASSAPAPLENVVVVGETVPDPAVSLPVVSSVPDKEYTTEEMHDSATGAQIKIHSRK